jgi:hypothetical protein
VQSHRATVMQKLDLRDVTLIADFLRMTLRPA